MEAYAEVYAPYIERNQGEVFMMIRDYLPGVDEKWFIVNYMKSHIRRLLDHANPKYAAMPPGELILRFVEDECGGKYKKGDVWGGFICEWAGRMYALYQWKHGLASEKLIDLVTLEDVERIYPALHQMGWEAALDKIYETVLDNGERRIQ